MTKTETGHSIKGPIWGWKQAGKSPPGVMMCGRKQWSTRWADSHLNPLTPTCPRCVPCIRQVCWASHCQSALAVQPGQAMNRPIWALERSTNWAINQDFFICKSVFWKMVSWKDHVHVCVLGGFSYFDCVCAVLCLCVFVCACVVLYKHILACAFTCQVGNSVWPNYPYLPGLWVQCPGYLYCLLCNIQVTFITHDNCAEHNKGSTGLFMTVFYCPLTWSKGHFHAPKSFFYYILGTALSESLFQRRSRYVTVWRAGSLMDTELCSGIQEVEHSVIRKNDVLGLGNCWQQTAVTSRVANNLIIYALALNKALAIRQLLDPESRQVKYTYSPWARCLFTSALVLNGLTESAES